MFYDWVSVINEFFYRVGWLAPRPAPNMDDQWLSFVRSLSRDESGMVEPARGKAPADIAQGITETLKLLRHNKATVPLE